MIVCNYETFWIINWNFSMHFWFAKSLKYIFKQHLRRFPYIGCKLCTHRCVCVGTINTSFTEEQVSRNLRIECWKIPKCFDILECFKTSFPKQLKLRLLKKTEHWISKIAVNNSFVLHLKDVQFFPNYLKMWIIFWLMGYLDPVLKRELTALPATKLIPQNYRYIGIFTPYYSLCLRRQSWDWGFCRITISQSNILSSSIVIVICLLVFYIICHVILVSNGTFYFIFIWFIVYDFDIIFSPYS